MRVRHTQNPLPRHWASLAEDYGLLGELDIRVRSRSRLWAKALMFDSNRNLRRFWKDILARPDTCRATKGIVTQLRETVVRQDGTTHLRVDPRYFCIIGLIAGYCGMEIVTHESVHAAFAYYKRTRGRTDLWPGSDVNEEEDVCYPAGRIASALAQWCHRHNYAQKTKWRKA